MRSRSSRIESNRVQTAVQCHHGHHQISAPVFRKTQMHMAAAPPKKFSQGEYELNSLRARWVKNSPRVREIVVMIASRGEEMGSGLCRAIIAVAAEATNVATVNPFLLWIQIASALMFPELW